MDQPARRASGPASRRVARSPDIQAGHHPVAGAGVGSANQLAKSGSAGTSRFILPSSRSVVVRCYWMRVENNYCVVELASLDWTSTFRVPSKRFPLVVASDSTFIATAIMAQFA